MMMVWIRIIKKMMMFVRPSFYPPPLVVTSEGRKTLNLRPHLTVIIVITIVIVITIIISIIIIIIIIMLNWIWWERGTSS